MGIRRAAQTLLGAAMLCCLLANVGCNSASSDSSDPTPVKPEGDWAMSLLAGGSVGLGMFPAKFTFDVNATPDCTNDFVVYNTSLAGTAAAAASQTGTFSNGLTPSGTIIITNGANSIILTASIALNTGLNFLVTNGNGSTGDATNLAAAIVRNGAAVGVTATAAAAVVTVTATSSGPAGNSITLGGTLTKFSWNSGTLAGGGGQANILAFNHLYSTQGGNCLGNAANGTGPQVYWSYFTGTGTAVTSVVLSLDGSKVAFVENVGTTATLRILQWQAGEGTAADGGVAPTTTLAAGQSWAANCPAGNSCISSIAFNGAAATDTRSAPFYDYNADTLYVLCRRRQRPRAQIHGHIQRHAGGGHNFLADHCERGSQADQSRFRWRIREYLRRRQYRTPELHQRGRQFGRRLRCGQPAVSRLGQAASWHGWRHC
jgi:hypothetical protein